MHFNITTTATGNCVQCLYCNYCTTVFWELRGRRAEYDNILFSYLRIINRLAIVINIGSSQDSVGKANLPATRKIMVRKYSKVLKP